MIFSFYSWVYEMSCLKNHIYMCCIQNLPSEKLSCVSPALVCWWEKWWRWECWSCTSCCCGCWRGWHWEPNSAHVVAVRGEGVQRDAHQQTAFSLLFEHGRAAVAAWATGNMYVRLGKEGQSTPGLSTEPAKVEVQQWVRFILDLQKVRQKNGWGWR